MNNKIGLVTMGRKAGKLVMGMERLAPKGLRRSL